MWFIKAFSIILIAALCTAQDAEGNATTLNDLPNVTMSSVTPALSVDPPAAHIYPGERVNLRCDATGSSPDWTYQWFHKDQGTPLPSAEPTSTEYTISSAAPADNGTYWCQIKRGEELSALSNGISFNIIDPPTPLLKVETQWSDVFPTEGMKMSCGVQGSSDWAFTWYNGGEKLNADSSLSLDPEGMSLTILSARQIHNGLYTCKSHHKTRKIQLKKRTKKISSGPSNSINVIVHSKKPKPLMTQDPSVDNMYAGKPVFFGCKVDVSTGWEYVWYKDGILSSVNGNSYNISSAASSDSGTYKCMAKRGTTAFNTDSSEARTLQIYDIPVPALMPMTPWSDVFPSEKVEMKCEVQGSSDWTFTWYRDGQKLDEDSSVSLGPEGSTVTVSHTSQTNTKYSCRAHHKTKPITTGDSNAFGLTVYANKPQARVTQTPSLKELYIGEPVSFSCMVDKSSGWEYMWYRDGAEVHTSSTYDITSPKSSDRGQYWCRAKRGKGQFTIDQSEKKLLQLSDPPKPSLEVQTQWLDVFLTERMEMKCGVQGSSDWTFTWYRNGQKLSGDSAVSLDAEGMSLTILSANQTHAGLYTCKSHHKTRIISSGPSNSADITVHQNVPKSTLKRSPGFDQMYVGELVTFSCEVDVFSGWEYLWFKDGKQLITSDSSKSNYTISSPAPSDGGMYTCKARRGKHEFSAQESSNVSLNIIEIPVPSLELQTPWLDVFPAERVEMSCRVQGSSDWTYTWYRDGHELSGDHISVSPGAEGSSLIISSAKHEDAGTYTCRGQHRTRPVKTQSNSTPILIVYANKPKPLMTQDPSAKKIYIGEPVFFSCKADVSSGWEYLWYKDASPLSNNSDSYNISSATSSDSGTYKCMAKRGTTAFNTYYSEVRTLQISAIPVPALKLMTPWSDVFPTESVELSCGVPDSSDWTYTWFRNRTPMQLDKSLSLDSDRATLSIHSASAIHAGEYMCRGRHKSRSVSTRSSSASVLTVYDEMPKPKAVLTQVPEFQVMHTEDSVDFSCEVTVSSGWEYQWYKDDHKIPLPLTSGNRHSISSAVKADTGEYQCQAKRGKKKEYHTEFSEARNIDIQERPWAVMTLLTGWSEVFSTDSLLFRCEVLDSQDQWNYTWFREGTSLGPSETLTVTPQDDPDQSQYTCKGIRFGRPSHSNPSDAFKTKNLLLKRRVLLSISGCLFFGILAVFIGCIALRITRKPDKKAEKPEEPNLFLTMAELKTCEDAPCPLDDYDRVSEVALPAANKETEADEDICSESTPLPLPVSPPEDQDVPSESVDTPEVNSLLSFKH